MIIITKEERIKYNQEAVRMLGWIFGWWKDDHGRYKVPIGFQVHHKDRDPSNNSLDNLVVLTVEEHRKIHEEAMRESGRENSKINFKKISKEIRSENGKKTGGRNKKRVLCIETGIIYESVIEASRQTGANYENIGIVCNGRRKTAGGYHWKFI